LLKTFFASATLDVRSIVHFDGLDPGDATAKGPYRSGSFQEGVPGVFQNVLENT
jgi:hypothetical protein